MGTLVSLDEYTAEAFRSYVDAVATIRDAESVRDKTRSAIIDYLKLHDGDVGTINNRPVVRLVRVDRTTLDTALLKTLEPFTYRKYSRTSTVEQLRQDGAGA